MKIVMSKNEDVINSYLNGELKDKNVVCNHDHEDHHQHKIIKISSK